MSLSPDFFARMAQELTEARAANLFPPTKAPSTDVQAVAHDYELLLQLQAARRDTGGSTSPRSCNNLLVEITRRIQDRDEVDDEVSSRDEAFRRVEHYLRSVEHENECFRSVSSSSSSSSVSGSDRGGHGCTSPPRTPARSAAETGPTSAAQTVEVSEEVIDIYEQAAEVAMSEVTTPMMAGIEFYAKMHRHQEVMYEQQQELHGLLQEDQRGLNDGHRSLNRDYYQLNIEHHSRTKELKERNEELRERSEELKKRNQEQEDLNNAARRLIRDIEQLKVAQSGILAQLKEQNTTQHMALTDLEDDIAVLKSAIAPAAHNLYTTNNILQSNAAVQSQLAQIVVGLPDAVRQIIHQITTQQLAAALGEMNGLLAQELAPRRPDGCRARARPERVAGERRIRGREVPRVAKLVGKVRAVFS